MSIAMEHIFIVSWKSRMWIATLTDGIRTMLELGTLGRTRVDFLWAVEGCPVSHA